MLEPDDPARAAALLGLFRLYRARRACRWLEATGSSMLPAIPAGTWLLVDFGAGEPRVGEIAIFPQGGRILAHRVVRVASTPEGRMLTTKGDSRLGFDQPVPAASILGTVRALRHGRTGTLDASPCNGARATAMGRLSAAGPLLERASGRLPAPVRTPIVKLGRRTAAVAFAVATRSPRQ